ncbi:HNH endonuclease signature motif containing protein [Geodermatophilus sp. CPCC 205761]|uniref:HNH endonuclease signature motif containing protein n=1 Tax=Geodermatophilus sp. CPCC 205761 TaxID=2936597 RepID=UPI003EECF470
MLDVGALIGVSDLDRTALAHRPHVAIVDKLRGGLVALTDAAGIRRGAALGPPPETDGYTPGAVLDRFVRLRDRRCRFPGCRRRARTCDLDHRLEWPEGPTAHHNLCCLCEHHHRLKHQAPGWRFDEADDGGLAVTMPNGEVLVSHPPRFGTDLDLPPY